MMMMMMMMVMTIIKDNELPQSFCPLFSDFSFSQMNPSQANREQYSELNTKGQHV